MFRPAIAIFILAAGVRIGYVAFCYLQFGPDGLMGPDSHGFLLIGQFLADGGSAFQGRGGQSGFMLGTMPVAFTLMSWTLTPGVAPDPFGYVLIQCWIDAATCILIGCLAAQFERGLFVPAALLAALNPTQIIVAGMVYTDTPFLFFATAGLLLSIVWLKEPSYGTALGAGLAWGLALMTRPFVQYWLVVLPVVLLVMAAIKHRSRNAKHLPHVMVMIILVTAVAAPVALRNLDQFGTLRLSAQSGAHFLFWISPLVREFKDGTPRAESNARLNRLYKNWKGTPPPSGPFETSDRMMEIAKEELLALGPVAVASDWVQGAAMNLSVPASAIAPPVSRLPRSGFYDTQGESFLDKVLNFLLHNDGAVYAQILLLSAAPIPAWIVLAIAGAYILLFRRPDSALPALVLLLWASFTLALNGPVFSPKYRLPLEPAWIVFASVGWVWLWRRMRRA
jgi:4-amino-4-deoxy-L-arabinose transferase-like glycosyltransferase